VGPGNAVQLGGEDLLVKEMLDGKRSLCYRIPVYYIHADSVEADARLPGQFETPHIIHSGDL
jgi:hypothetical protein